jgi:hypothetical protein
MDKDHFDKYQKQIFKYHYKFILLGREEYSKKGFSTRKWLTYRYWGETDTFDKSIVEDIGPFPNKRKKTFSKTLNLLQPEQYLLEEIENLKAKILNEARVAKEEENKRRLKLEGAAFHESPPAYWEFYKSQDFLPEKAEQTIAEWKRIHKVYELHKAGKRPKEILAQEADLFSHLSSEYNNASKYKRISKDLSLAKKLIKSAINDTFPLID